MKCVMLSIRPKYCELIASGKKTVEVRKTKPKIDVPFKCYIYETKDKKFENIGVHWENGRDFIHNGGKVIGEFVCRNIDYLNERDLFDGMDEISNGRIEEYSCLSIDELLRYKGDKQEIYAWNITDLVIYEQPKDLSEFRKICQSDYCHTCDYAVKKNGYLFDCDRSVKRPPQSWCYCEELKGETE